MPPAAGIGAGALLGGIAGSMKDQSDSTSTSTVDAGSATGMESYGKNLYQDNVDAYGKMVGQGADGTDVAAYTGSQRDLADMLKNYQSGGYTPSSEDTDRANFLAKSQFGAQRVGMEQNFQDQLTQFQRQATLMGRDVNDPVLRAKLAQEQTRQGALLDANQNAYATNYANQMPMQRLQFAQARAGVLGGLATQAMQNRQALAAMGQGIMTDERNFRLATASRTNMQQNQSGGGWKGAIMGGMAGAGMGGQMAAPQAANAQAPAGYGQPSPYQGYGGGMAAQNAGGYGMLPATGGPAAMGGGMGGASMGSAGAAPSAAMIA